MWIYVGGPPKSYIFYFFSQNNETNWWRGRQLEVLPCGQLFCFGTDRLWSFLSHHVVAGQVHLICTVQDHDQGAKKWKSSIWQAVKKKPTTKKPQKNKLVILSKGSMVRRNLHHKISHNIENYLRRENVSFFCVNCQFDRMRFSTSVYAKSCPFHDYYFF